MKNFCFIVFVMWLAASCTPKRPSTVERPVFDVWNSTTIEIDRIELSDSATVFYIEAYYRPNNWIMIAKETYIRESGGSEKLTITRADGIALGEKVFMPESGTMSFKLYFPPLNPEVTKIDFIESDCAECFKIWGIHLLSGERVETEQVATRSKLPLPAPTYGTELATVSGRFAGWVAGMQPAEVRLYGSDPLTGESKDISWPIAADGTFSGTYAPGLPSGVYTSVGELFLAPGSTVNVTVDLKKRSRYQSKLRTDKEASDSLFTSVSGSVFTDAEMRAIGESDPRRVAYEQLTAEVAEMTPEEYQKHLLTKMNVWLALNRQKNLPKKAETAAEQRIKLSAFALLLDYRGFVSRAYIRKHKIEDSEFAKIILKTVAPPVEYYGFLKGALTDSMCYSQSYPYFVAQLMNVDHFAHPSGAAAPAGERFTYFRDKLAAATGISDGLLLDLAKARFYGEQLSEMKLYTDADKEALRQVFADVPAIADALSAESDRLAAMLEENRGKTGATANDMPAASQEKMFDAIMAKYKGKAVVVDFWATWCVPCMNAMNAIKPLKEEMRGKDVVFLYLTGETSPLNKWLQTYPDITGEHFRVSETQWSYWYSTYGIQGIPTYMVYNKKGEQTSRYTGFPGTEQMKTDIEKAMR